MSLTCFLGLYLYLSSSQNKYYLSELLSQILSLYVIIEIELYVSIICLINVNFV